MTSEAANKQFKGEQQVPDRKSHLAIERQWKILRLLPNTAPGLTVVEVAGLLKADGYDVTERTVDRDLNDLIRVFGICQDVDGIRFRWRWMDARSLDVKSLTVDEAVSTKLIEDLLRPLVPPALLRPLEGRFEHARHKLEALGEETPMARWPRKVRYVPPDLPRLAPTVDPAVLQTVHEALFADKQFKVTYQRRDGAVRHNLALHPRALLQKGAVSYLVAKATDRADLRFYALHRMSNAEQSFEPCQLEPEFDLEEFLKNGESQFKPSSEVLHLVARVNEDLAHSLRERPLTVDQRLEPLASGYLLESTVCDSFDLVCWIMSVGPALTVLEPASLRNKIAEKVRQQAQQYGLLDRVTQATASSVEAVKQSLKSEGP